MPFSIKQRRAAAIAEHDPGKLNADDKGFLGMSQGEQHDFASGSEQGLPEKSGGPPKPPQAPMGPKAPSPVASTKAKEKGFQAAIKALR